jgi:predicted unusual protein kinase regulating ubiquinone biosynthesis (AarF/ABC1/UbiB family)
MAADHDDAPGGRAVPAARAARLARFGGLGVSVAGRMAADGARRALRGERPKASDLLLTPGNAAKVADELSQLRGAAMKIGQLLSMDGGDFVPPELAGIFDRLRASAHAMPGKQLRRVLADAWGKDWLRGFERFDVNPLAAASIGQVHRAVTKDGRDLAIKVQYPGVRQSVDSDIDNAAGLIRLAGLIPKGVDVAPLLEEAKRSLRDEADYEREASFLRRYREHLGDDPDFAVPEVHDDLTTKDVLAMTYMPGVPIEAVAAEPQEVRDRVVRLLMDLVMRELWTFRLMQTDPNFANYAYDPETKRIVLLDFGAARVLPDALADGYRDLLRAGLPGDWDAVHEAALRMGVAGETMATEHQALMAELFDMAMEPMRHDGPYDFGRTDLATRIRDRGMALRTGGFTHVPPPATLFVHRKFGGTYLLATKLKARVDLGALLRPYLGTDAV